MGVLRPKPKESGKGSVGAKSEATIMAALINAGYTVLTPNGYMLRYDIVIEDADGNFWKIQCKTAWLAKDKKTLKFSGCSLAQEGQRGRKQSTRKHYRNDVHFFAVCSPDTGKVYLLPISEVGDTENTLRLVATVNNQKKHVKWAQKYEL